MTSLLLSPHNDDAALFAAFTCYAEQPFVVTVLRSYVQEARGTGITYEQREAEDREAMEVLGCSWEQWAYRDDDPDWPKIERDLALIAHPDERLWPSGGHAAELPFDPVETVYAPLPEHDGHEHHNRLGEIVARQFGSRARFYSTYTKWSKSETGTPVEPSPGALPAKLRALACYPSQIVLDNCRPHFLRGLEEYLT